MNHALQSVLWHHRDGDGDAGADAGGAARALVGEGDMRVHCTVGGKKSPFRAWGIGAGQPGPSARAVESRPLWGWGVGRRDECGRARAHGNRCDLRFEISDAETRTGEADRGGGGKLHWRASRQWQLAFPPYCTATRKKAVAVAPGTGGRAARARGEEHADAKQPSAWHPCSTAVGMAPCERAARWAHVGGTLRKSRRRR